MLLSLIITATLAFTSGDDYLVKYIPESNVFNATNEQYYRPSCTTCCRVLFASDYNYVTQSRFTTSDTDTRYVMDMEFDKANKVRSATGDWEQNILLRPINMGNELQFWEFAPYKMFISFPIPRRVHDIRSGAIVGNTLIIWAKKPPLDIGTNNQRFMYVHPYDGYPTTATYSVYKQHFYIPYQNNYNYALCYQARKASEARSTWSGNSNLNVLTSSYQITAQRCDANLATQFFVPIFA
ncbi:hypothetical protein EIN_130190 [Entamoeba invadens IP1]|uniref:Galactose-inhibitable lectin 35 kDa subunit n=1 Tax=Entamoeba invadens IP1 TaxID=370355 RepID=A0A0A1UFZ4_ENTIV|nr:hypothetical protein EIN_130190 [Entamoeba invadens IP1]ELP94300.1 hypothetical protein EIN_130190 [Entamoeba invadens IP1]|eukprot:XP_004261071.1 hypothetical protein EIN_130190 [Entamoeba invadens IP1]